MFINIFRERNKSFYNLIDGNWYASDFIFTMLWHTKNEIKFVKPELLNFNKVGNGKKILTNVSENIDTGCPNILNT